MWTMDELASWSVTEILVRQKFRSVWTIIFHEKWFARGKLVRPSPSPSPSPPDQFFREKNGPRTDFKGDHFFQWQASMFTSGLRERPLPTLPSSDGNFISYWLITPPMQQITREGCFDVGHMWPDDFSSISVWCGGRGGGTATVVDFGKPVSKCGRLTFAKE